MRASMHHALECTNTLRASQCWAHVEGARLLHVRISDVFVPTGQRVDGVAQQFDQRRPVASTSWTGLWRAP
jgi:hypothetical protein